MTSRLITCCLIVVSSLLLISCASFKAILPEGCKPDASSGYIAGLFSGSAKNLGFGIVNVESKEEIIMPFFSEEERFASGYTPEQVTMIKVPPGQYRIAYWVIIAGIVPKTKYFSGQKKPEAFTVNPGRVVFIGSYSTVKSINRNYGATVIKYVISPNRVSVDKFDEKFKDKHPEFYSNNFGPWRLPLTY